MNLWPCNQQSLHYPSQYSDRLHRSRQLQRSHQLSDRWNRRRRFSRPQRPPRDSQRAPSRAALGTRTRRRGAKPSRSDGASAPGVRPTRRSTSPPPSAHAGAVDRSGALPPPRTAWSRAISTPRHHLRRQSDTRWSGAAARAARSPIRQSLSGSAQADSGGEPRSRGRMTRNRTVNWGSKAWDARTVHRASQRKGVVDAILRCQGVSLLTYAPISPSNKLLYTSQNFRATLFWLLKSFSVTAKQFREERERETEMARPAGTTSKMWEFSSASAYFYFILIFIFLY